MIQGQADPGQPLGVDENYRDAYEVKGYLYSFSSSEFQLLIIL